MTLETSESTMAVAFIDLEMLIHTSSTFEVPK